MELHRDFKELLESFNAHGVEYVLVGAYALAFHGAPRYTADLDLFVRPCARERSSHHRGPWGPRIRLPRSHCRGLHGTRPRCATRRSSSTGRPASTWMIHFRA